MISKVWVRSWTWIGRNFHPASLPVDGHDVRSWKLVLKSSLNLMKLNWIQITDVFVTVCVLGGGGLWRNQSKSTASSRDFSVMWQSWEYECDTRYMILVSNWQAFFYEVFCFWSVHPHRGFRLSPMKTISSFLWFVFTKTLENNMRWQNLIKHAQYMF